MAHAGIRRIRAIRVMTTAFTIHEREHSDSKNKRRFHQCKTVPANNRKRLGVSWKSAEVNMRN